MALKAKRLKGLKIAEVSGVDAPAHLAPGALVMKAVDALAELTDEQVEALTKAFMAEEEEPMGTTTEALATPGWLVRKAAADAGRPLTAEEVERCAAFQKALSTAQEERQRWSSITPEAVDRVVKGWLDPVQRIERAADALQEAEPALDRATAILKAVDANPDLESGYAEALQPTSPVEKAEIDPAWAALEEKADQLQEAAPAMDRPTAIVKAADIWPDLAQAVSHG
jgi:hypothetical protein